jgi:hypothetical protein
MPKIIPAVFRWAALLCAFGLLAGVWVKLLCAVRALPDRDRASPAAHELHRSRGTVTPSAGMVSSTLWLNEGRRWLGGDKAENLCVLPRLAARMKVAPGVVGQRYDLGRSPRLKAGRVTDAFIDPSSPQPCRHA